MSAHLYIEGSNTGPNSKEDQIRCREAFRKLLEKAGFSGRMPRLTASGGRNSAYLDFKIAHAKQGPGDYIAMLVDSEEPVEVLEETWAHLKRCDRWDQPPDAVDEQVLLMTTCMETWIVGDRAALRDHYGTNLQESVLPPMADLEHRGRSEVHDKLARASRNCSNAYAKGKRSFALLAQLEPNILKRHLPSFVRVDRILKCKL